MDDGNTFDRFGNGLGAYSDSDSSDSGACLQIFQCKGKDNAQKKREDDFHKISIYNYIMG